MSTQKTYQIYLAGNPNAGKTSLFNQLTGLNQRTANYPGITVEKKSAMVSFGATSFEMIDLPGTYSLYPNSPDEEVVLKEMLMQKQDLTIVVCDSTNLMRGLLLYTQIADLDTPVIVVLNMMDELARKGLEINLPFLEKELGVPIFTCNSKTGAGVDAIKQYLQKLSFQKSQHSFFKRDLFHVASNSEGLTYFQWHSLVHHAPKNALSENIKRLETLDRYNQIEKITQLTVKPTAKSIARKRNTERLDKLMMHSAGGYVFLVLILLLVFQSIFSFAGYPMEWIDRMGSAFSNYTLSLQPDSLLIKLLAGGIIPGITGIVMFVPQIALLFLFITLLEESGYMARVVFLMDRIMRLFGLSGKSLLPLVSGNACAIPAILSTRSINNHKERLITILAIPFTTCSARLPVYTILIALFIPAAYQGLTLLGLYTFGMVAAVVMATILNQFIPSKEPSTLVLEMPPLRIPSFKNVVINVVNAVRAFVERAGKIILAFTIILWVLSSFGPANFENNQYHATEITLETSYAGKLGKMIEPVFAPLGYDWKIDIALITSFAAREIFVSTLATIYSFDAENSTTSGILAKLKEQVNHDTGQPVFTPAVSASLLVFYIFALQCFSTLGAIKSETNSTKWTLFSFVLMSTMAYLLSFITFILLK